MTGYTLQGPLLRFLRPGVSRALAVCGVAFLPTAGRRAAKKRLAARPDSTARGITTMTQGALYFSIATLVLLGAGCVSTPPQVMGDDTLSGRMTVKVDAAGEASASSVSGAFELRGNAQVGEMVLTSPWGSVYAQAQWWPGSALLITSQTQTRFADLDLMMSQMLGENLPTAALFDWLRGRPWPGAASALLPTDGFEQLGWRISLVRFAEGYVTARRERAPTVTLTAKLNLP